VQHSTSVPSERQAHVGERVAGLERKPAPDDFRRVARAQQAPEPQARVTGRTTSATSIVHRSQRRVPGIIRPSI
jgi:hypothetical protein